MNPHPRTLIVLGILLAGTAGFTPVAAAGGPWQVGVSGVSAQSTAGDDPDAAFGLGASVAYRATPRIGFALAGLSSDVDGLDIDFFLPGRFDTELELTAVLARLDLHLTAGPRADFYLGPVAGYASLSDVTVDHGGFESRIRTDDELAWGAHAGLDFRLGDGRSSLNLGVMYLDVPLELEFDVDGPTLEAGTSLVALPEGGDLDPLIVHFGYAYRF